ncbi:hypothetical protein MWU52_14710 [Jannaschia sp. S6380]|uniref:hypothetical protein n=1 Tax=Jannaschia sp. S6380 TaxID=2926408 RepID=UPI001FF41C3D|nr:hypothetical protein [Jannaschia sp. S6380]MCK0168808.1 hypothetical protein [Jannaschia sp. S6380]
MSCSGPEGADWTVRRDRAVESLRHAVRTAPIELRDAIADYDGQALPGDTPKHREALERLIEEHDCVLGRMPGNQWYPSEPIELASFGVDGQGATLTAFACCFLLIDDLVCSRMDYMDFRLSNSPGRAFFDTPPDSFRIPLLDGIGVYDDMQDPTWT